MRNAYVAGLRLCNFVKQGLGGCLGAVPPLSRWLLLLLPGAVYASVIYDSVSASTASGTATGGVLNVSMTYSVKADTAPTGDAIKSIELREGSTALATINYPSQAGASPIYNTVRNDTITAGLVPGQHSIYLRAYSEQGYVGDTGTFSVYVAAPNQRPTVHLSSPSGSVVVTSSNGAYTLPVQGYATDPDNNVVRMQTLVNGARGTPVNASTFNGSVALGYGVYIVGLRAEDSEGAADEAGVFVTVNQAPSVSLTMPTAGTVFQTQGTATTAPVRVQGTASDADGSIIRLEVWLDGNKVESTGYVNYDRTFDLAFGEHTIELRAYDNYEASATTGVASFTVESSTNTAPSIILVKPASGLTINEQPYALHLEASAGDADGNLASVKFYAKRDDGVVTEIGTGILVGGFYMLDASITTLPAGNYQLYAVAKDGQGAKATSASVSLVVNNLVPVVSLQVLNNNVQLALGYSATNVTFAGLASDANGQLAKLELFKDAGSGYDTTPVADIPTSGFNRVTIRQGVSVEAGTYRFKLRATDNQGAVSESNPVYVNIVASSPIGNFKGVVNGIRFSNQAKPELLGWACQNGVPTPLNVQLFVNAPPGLGGTLIGNGRADLAEEVDNEAIQIVCETSGVGHRYRVDLSPYTATYAGSPIYVQALAADGASSIVLPCEDNTCTMPGSLSIALTTPENQSHYAGQSSVFAKAKLLNGVGPYDAVEFYFDDGGWVTGQADTQADTYYASKVLAPRSSPYRVQARVLQGNTTLYSPERQVFVDALNASLSLTSPQSTYTQGASISLVATPPNGATGIASVRFSQAGIDIGQGAFGNGAWRFDWVNAPVGSYTVLAQAMDSAGVELARATLNISMLSNDGGAGAKTLADIVLPHLGEDNAGTLPGNVGVTNNGAATYEIPLSLPPGTAGVLPALQLSYSSQSSNGILGVGWSLEGMSAVARCSKNIAIDGEAGAVRFNSADRLCMNGERLVLVNMPTSDANYWSDSAEYRLEKDDFTRVLAMVSNGHRAFKVQNKSGETLYYGDQGDSYVEAQGRADGAARKWALRHVEDAAGNAIDYEYALNKTTGEHLPKSARWGGNAQAGLGHYAKVEFTYGTDDNPDADRPDPEVGYLGGSHTDTRKRLREIVTYADTASDGSGGTLGLRYALTYDQSPISGRSRLTSVQACGANADCLPASRFSWGEDSPVRYASLGHWDGPFIPTKLKEQFTLDPKVLGSLLVADLDGNGASDLVASDAVYLSSNSGFVKVPYPSQLPDQPPLGSTLTLKRPLVGDFDGDGKPDLLWLRTEQFSNAPTNYYMTRCQINTNGSPWSSEFACDPEISLGITQLVSDFIADVDGAGKQEMLLTDGGGQRCAINVQGVQCKPFSNVADVKQRIETLMGDDHKVLANMLKQGGDFDGDGISDYLFTDGTLCLTRPTGFDCKMLPGFLPHFDELTPALEGSLFADMNGDGLTDFPYLDRGKGDGFEQGICYGTGTGFDCKPISNMAASGLNSVGRIIGTGNVRGDGAPAWLFPIGGCSLMDSTLHCVDGVAPPNWDGPQGPALPNTYMVGDFTGNGQIGIATYRGGNAGTGWEIYSASTSAGNDRIVNVENGLGHQYGIEYGVGSEVYAATWSKYVDPNNIQQGVHNYPLRSVANPGPLVATLHIGHGTNTASNINTYRYAGGAIDVSGRGNVGIATRQVWSTDSGRSPVEWYRQDWPFTGMLEARLVIGWDVSGDSMVNAMERKDTVHPNGAITTFPYIRSSVSQRADLGLAYIGTTNTTSEYDSFGNLNRVDQVAVGVDGRSFESTTVNSFDNDTSAWRLGQLRTQRITKLAASGQLSRSKSFDYYPNGLLYKETVEPGNPALQVSTVYERNNSAGLVTKRSKLWHDPDANADKNQVMDESFYDARNRFAVKVKNGLGHEVNRAYDSRNGAATSLTNVNGVTTTWLVDAFGRNTQEFRSDGSEVRFYNKKCEAGCELPGARSVVIADQLKNGNRIALPSISYFDKWARSLGTMSFSLDGRVVYTLNDFDEQDRPLRTYLPFFKGSSAIVASQIDYDWVSRPIVKYINGDDGESMGLEQTTYDGLSTSYSNAKGQYKQETRDILGQLVATRLEDAGAGSNITQYEYDAFSSLTKTTDPLGNTVKVFYDNLGRKIRLEDPDLGTVTYDVNPLGQVWRQASAKQALAGQSVHMVYDILGRLTDRYEPDLESHWIYDQSGGSSCLGSRSCGSLVESYTGQLSAKDFIRRQTYDVMGRPSVTTTVFGTAGDQVFTSTQEYDDDFGGRSKRQVHQRGNDAPKAFDYKYNAMAYQHRIERNGLLLWETTEQDAAGHATRATLGNGLKVERTYNDYTGRFNDGLLKTSAGSIRVQEGYQYDILGNVLLRSQHWDVGGFQEGFEYDTLNRLISSEVVGPPQSRQDFAYNVIGNIVSKTGTGTGDYVYPSAGSVLPHAVSSIPGIGVFSYDKNGNLLQGAGRSLCWTSFDMPSRINKGGSDCDDTAGTWSSFKYGTEHQRTVQLKSDGTTIRYAGAMEVETKNGNATVKTYWPAGLGVEVDQPGQATMLNWTHVDRLGSVIAISDSTGNIVERLAYDAWGKRRSLDGSTTPAVIDNKGFTGHEMLDQLDLVHMNGRVYDPLITRFVSADPLVQDPTHSQSYNRYTYVWNNPTNLTDPTGFAAIGGTEWASATTAGMNSITLQEEGAKPSGDGKGDGVGEGGPCLTVKCILERIERDGDAGEKIIVAGKGGYTLTSLSYRPGMNRVTEGGGPKERSEASWRDMYQRSVVANRRLPPPLAAKKPVQRKRFTQIGVSTSASLFLGFVGVSGGTSVGISTDGTLDGTTAFLSVQVNGLVGIGGYAGGGLSPMFGRSDNQVTDSIGDTAGYVELDAGYGPAASVSVSVPNDADWSTSGSDFKSPLKVFPSAGFGSALGVGKSNSSTLTFLNLGNVARSVQQVFR